MGIFAAAKPFSLILYLRTRERSIINYYYMLPGTYNTHVYIYIRAQVIPSVNNISQVNATTTAGTSPRSYESGREKEVAADR